MKPLIAGLALGLASSAHCAAMCGPLVLVARAAGMTAAHRAVGWRAWNRLLHYHAGRAAMYALLGVLAGTAGSGLVRAGLGSALSVVAGVLLIAHAVLGRAPVGWPAWSTRLRTASTVWLSRLALGRGMHSPMVHGAVHGLLPCGTLYLAIAAAAGMGTVAEACVLMAGFAVGTGPILALIAVSGSTLAARLPGAVRRAAPAALALVGLLLVARGVGVAPAMHAASPAGPAAHEAHHGQTH